MSDARPPDGFFYQPGFISGAEEKELVARVRELRFSEVKLRGVVARRHVAHFGRLYHYESRIIEPGPAMPEFFLPLRARAAALAGVEPDALA